jgi:hypothetical protein
MVKCTKCHKSSPCGCADTPFTTNYNYTTCTSQQICDEYVYTSCVIYNGPELTGLNVIPGMNMNQVIQAIYLYQIDPACISTTCHSPFVNVLGTTATSINVGWASVAEAASYTVRYRDVSVSPPSAYTVLPAVSNSTTSLNITGLTCGTTYEIIVQAAFSTTDCDSLTITVTTSAC